MVKNAFRLQETVSSLKGKRFVIPNQETVRFPGAHSCISFSPVQSFSRPGWTDRTGRAVLYTTRPQGEHQGERVCLRARLSTSLSLLPSLSRPLSLSCTFPLSPPNPTTKECRRRVLSALSAAGERDCQYTRSGMTRGAIRLHDTGTIHDKTAPTWRDKRSDKGSSSTPGATYMPPEWIYVVRNTGRLRRLRVVIRCP
jgi:hypothetical protein